MQPVQNYLDWLSQLELNTQDERTKNSIRKFTSLLIFLESKKIFTNNNNKILKRIDFLKNKLTGNPAKTRYYIDRCIKDTANISAKFYNLVKPSYYTEQYTAFGTAIGCVIGVTLFVLTNNAVYFALGLPVGIPVGMAIGYMLDKQAKKENRVLAEA